MCKKCSWLKIVSGSSLMNFFVALLIFSQLYLIIDVICIVNKENKSSIIHKEVVEPIRKNDAVKENTVAHFEITDTSQSLSEINSAEIERISVNIVKNTVDSVVEKAINSAVKGNAIVSKESNDNAFTSIMLALITLCVTLAVVIPYVIGKAITQDEIRNEVQKHNKQFDKRIDEAVKKLEWSEAHTSRMIAYLLLNKQKSHPDWAIGWASKSLIRYLKQEKPEPWTTDFCAECVNFIIDGLNMLNDNDNIDIDEKHKIRAIKDAYDAWCLISKSKILKLEIDVIKSIKAGIASMYKSLIDENKYTHNDIIREIAKASKFKLYMGDNATEDDFEKKFYSDIVNPDTEIKDKKGWCNFLCNIFKSNK